MSLRDVQILDCAVGSLNLLSPQVRADTLSSSGESRICRLAVEADDHGSHRWDKPVYRRLQLDVIIMHDRCCKCLRPRAASATK